MPTWIMVRDLPTDLVAYLRAGMPPTLDAAWYGRVELIPVEELRVETLTVTPTMAPFRATHPHADEFGHYPVPAINLVRRGDRRAFPAWLFLWLPNESRYGSFDLDHGDLIVYPPTTTWADILDDPKAFVSAGDGTPQSWVPLEYLEPWHSYRFVAEEYPFKQSPP
jgi:hypothetical protein